MIVGGGPSLAKNIEHIRGLREKGVKLIAPSTTPISTASINGIMPSAFVMVDARAFNARVPRQS
jgi:hypothetical protein